MSLTISEMIFLTDLQESGEITVTATNIGEDPNLVLCRLIAKGLVRVDRAFDYRLTDAGINKLNEALKFIEGYVECRYGITIAK